MAPAQVLDLLARRGPVAILKGMEGPAVTSAVGALLRGGIRAVEVDPVRPRPPQALLRQYAEDPSILVGLGGVLSPREVKVAGLSGAAWVAFPGPREELLAAAGEALLLAIAVVRTQGELDLALDRNCPCIRVAPPLVKGFDPPHGTRSPSTICLEAAWPEPCPAWASFVMIAGGLFHPAAWRERSFGELERQVREALAQGNAF